MYIVMNASHEQTDHVDRARLVGSRGARDDSTSWNLGRAQQCDTIRVDYTSARGRGQEDVKSPRRRVLQCAGKVKYKAKSLSGMLS